MKIHSNTYRIFTFLIILIFCAVPPIFTKAPDIVTFIEWTFPFRQLCYAMFAAFLLYFSRDLSSASKPPFYRQLIFSLITFVLLVLVAFSVQKFADFLGETKTYNIQTPDTAWAFIFCILNFIFSAFYEEVIYRFFIPETLGKIFAGLSNARLRNFLCDFVSLVLFSLGHLYMGFFSVLNAAFAYAVLRFCFKKAKNVFTGTAAHFAYNLFQLFISPL